MAVNSKMTCPIGGEQGEEGCKGWHTDPENEQGEEQQDTDNTIRNDHDYNTGYASIRGIETRLNSCATNRDWGEEVKELMKIEGIQAIKRDSGEYFGDNMNPENKSEATGCRLITRNAQGKCAVEEGGKYYFETELEYGLKMKADIIVIHEPGAIEGMRGQITKIAKSHGCTAIIKNSGAAKSEGVIIILTEAWQMVTDGKAKEIGGKGHSHARVVQLEFKAAENKKTKVNGKTVWLPLERMALFAVYGYAGKDKKTQTKTRALWETVGQRIKKYKASVKHRLATVIMAGDLNAANSTALDTDREVTENKWIREKDAWIIDHIKQTTKLYDLFREAHPKVRAYTRIPQEGKVYLEASRRLDQIWGGINIANSPALKIGIPRENPLGSDHLPVIIDIPINCAGMATGVEPMWVPHTTIKLQLKTEGEITEEDKEKFTENFIKEMPTRQSDDRERRGEDMLKGLYNAAKTTVAKEQKLRYPNFAATTEHREGWGEKLDTWTKRMKGACRTMKNWTQMKDRGKAKNTLRKAAWPHKDTPEGLHMERMSNLLEEWTAKVEGGDSIGKIEIADRVHEQIKAVNKHRQLARATEKRKKIAAAVKTRNENFEEKSGKGKGKLLANLFRKRKEFNELRWVRRKDGTVASSLADVGSTVREFFEQWFKSRVSVEERWGSMQAMLELDTTKMSDENKSFVQECYTEQYEANKVKAEAEGWWTGVRKDTNRTEMEKAMKRTKNNKASGPSQVSADIIKLLGPGGIDIVIEFYNDCIRTSKMPDAINSALMRLLPKTEQGLDNLDLVRPIALIENLVKIYEQIMIGRVIDRLMKFNVIDLGQFGAVPNSGVQAPLRMLAELMDDARMSGQQLHIMVADLSKAFDTMEYWSQALSWKCLGMPQEMIDLLVNLDSGSTEPGAKGATTQILLGQGRVSESFKHGRGVRQGSVGGPIKWVVFVHFWIQWVKKKMKGRGYKMSSEKVERTIEEIWKNTGQKLNKEEAQELLGMMFVDDSIWPTKDAESMQEAVRLHETFCDFHKVFIHKKKSEYIAANGTGQQVRWTSEKHKEEGRAQEEAPPEGEASAPDNKEDETNEDHKTRSDGGSGHTTPEKTTDSIRFAHRKAMSAKAIEHIKAKNKRRAQEEASPEGEATGANEEDGTKNENQKARDDCVSRHITTEKGVDSNRITRREASAVKDRKHIQKKSKTMEAERQAYDERECKAHQERKRRSDKTKEKQLHPHTQDSEREGNWPDITPIRGARTEGIEHHTNRRERRAQAVNKSHTYKKEESTKGAEEEEQRTVYTRTRSKEGVHTTEEENPQEQGEEETDLPEVIVIESETETEYEESERESEEDEEEGDLEEDNQNTNEQSQATGCSPVCKWYHHGIEYTPLCEVCNIALHEFNNCYECEAHIHSACGHQHPTETVVGCDLRLCPPCYQKTAGPAQPQLEQRCVKCNLPMTEAWDFDCVDCGASLHFECGSEHPTEEHASLPLRICDECGDRRMEENKEYANIVTLHIALKQQQSQPRTRRIDDASPRNIFSRPRDENRTHRDNNPPARSEPYTRVLPKPGPTVHIDTRRSKRSTQHSDDQSDAKKKKCTQHADVRTRPDSGQTVIEIEVQLLTSVLWHWDHGRLTAAPDSDSKVTKNNIE